MIGLMANSKRVYANESFQCLCACGEPLLTHASTGDPPTLAGSFDFGFLWGHGSSPLGLGACKILFVPSKTGVSGSLSPLEGLWSNPAGPQGQVPWGFSVPLLDPQAGIQNLRNSGRTSLVLLFSSLWVTHLAGMGFDFIVIASLLLSCCSFFFVFGRGVSFFGGFQYPPVDCCSTGNCNFGALAGGDKHTSFYSAILSWKTPCLLYLSMLLLLPVLFASSYEF